MPIMEESGIPQGLLGNPKYLINTLIFKGVMTILDDFSNMSFLVKIT